MGVVPHTERDVAIAPTPVAPPAATVVPTAASLPNLDHHHDNKGKDHEPGRQAQNKAVPRKPSGLGSIRGMAGVRIVRAIGMDDRPKDAPSVLPNVQRDDVRRGGTFHLPVRGPRANKMTGAVTDAPTRVPQPVRAKQIAREPTCRRPSRPSLRWLRREALAAISSGRAAPIGGSYLLPCAPSPCSHG